MVKMKCCHEHGTKKKSESPTGFEPMTSFVLKDHLYHVVCFFQAMDSVRRSQSSDVLTEAEEVSAFLLELAHFFHEWRFTLPDVLILLLVTLISCFFFMPQAAQDPAVR